MEAGHRGYLVQMCLAGSGGGGGVGADRPASEHKATDGWSSWGRGQQQPCMPCGTFCNPACLSTHQSRCSHEAITIPGIVM